MCEKVCAACGETKPIEEFALLKSGRRYSYCRQCKRRKSNSWRQNNLKKANDLANKYRKERVDQDPIGYYAKQMLTSSKARAKRKGWAFDLTEEFIKSRLLKGVCEVTGIEFDLSVSGGPWSPSIDRIDSDGGYTQDNIQFTVWMFNQAKNRWQLEDLIKLSSAVVSHF